MKDVLLKDALRKSLEHIKGAEIERECNTTLDVLNGFNELYETCKVTFSVVDDDSTTLTTYDLSVIDPEGDPVDPKTDGKYRLPAGNNKYTCHCEGYVPQDNQTVTIQSSDVTTGTKTVTITMAHPTSEVTFSVTPDTATIVVKDSESQTVQPTAGKYKLRAGNYTYTATADGYTTLTDVALVISAEDIKAGTKTVTVTMVETQDDED